MPRRYHLRPVKSHQPPALGFCNETGKELHLHEIVDLLTDPLKGQTTTPTILVVHARGVEGGDEARLKAMGININEVFCHAIDTQTLAADVCPLPKGQAWSLQEMIKIVCWAEPMMAQCELSTARQCKGVKHNALDDASRTLEAFLTMTKLYAGWNNKTSSENATFKLVAIDFEGGGGPTTEVGIATVDNFRLGTEPGDWSTQRHHIIVTENINSHPCYAAQRKMGINHRLPNTYPRWNAQTGPNGANKHFVTVDNERYFLSKDSKFMSFQDIKDYVLALIKSDNDQQTEPEHATWDTPTLHIPPPPGGW